MKATIKNNSKALQGVHTTDGLVFIEPGRQRTVVLAADYVAHAKRLPFLDIEDKGDPLDHDNNGEKGGMARPAEVQPPAEFDPSLVEAMTDAELRAHITERDGRAPHPKTGREKLIAKALGAD